MALGNAKANGKEPIIEVRDVVAGFGEHVVLDHIDLDVHRGEVLGFVGGSGAGKSVLMRTIIGLVPKRGGTIKVFGVDMDAASDDERQAVERRWGVLFQQGALFSSLTVQGKPAIPGARISRSVAAAARRTGGRQARNGRPRRHPSATSFPRNSPAA